MLVWSLLFKIPVSNKLSVHDLYLQQFVYFVSNETLHFAVSPQFTCMPNCGGRSVLITDQIRSVTPLLISILLYYVPKRLQHFKPRMALHQVQRHQIDPDVCHRINSLCPSLWCCYNPRVRAHLKARYNKKYICFFLWA